MIMKLTIKEAITDLTNEFLARIIEKPVWKKEEVVSEFHKSLYQVALDYLSQD